jgi:maltose O-acetyltransferase
VWGDVTPWTHHSDARITVGDHTDLDGVRFGCAMEITIGSHCMISRCRILDTDFHSTRVDRRLNPSAPIRVAPVRIHDNVWIGLEVGILAGTVIGRNSVVAYGSVCLRDYPENSVMMGNPARVVSPIASGGEAPQPARPYPP